MFRLNYGAARNPGGALNLAEPSGLSRDEAPFAQLNGGFRGGGL